MEYHVTPGQTRYWMPTKARYSDWSAVTPVGLSFEIKNHYTTFRCESQRAYCAKEEKEA